MFLSGYLVTLHLNDYLNCKVIVLKMFLLFEVHKSILFSAEYKVLCPGGEGFRPNPITVILEGNVYIFL